MLLLGNAGGEFLPGIAFHLLRGKPEMADKAYRWFGERMGKEPGMILEEIKTPD